MNYVCNLIHINFSGSCKFFISKNFRTVMCAFIMVDLLQKDNVEDIISKFQIDYILRMAATYSSVRI